MNLLLKSGAIVFLGGGGASVIPFIKFPTLTKNTPVITTVNHSSGLDHSQSNSSIPEVSLLKRSSGQHTQQTHNITEEAENCSFKSNEDKSFIQPTSSSINYLVFSCDNSGRHEEVIRTTWTIWLPKTLLNESQSSLKDGMRVNIKTQTSDIEYGSDSTDYYKTKFESNIFTVRSITGTWGGNFASSELDFSPEEEQVYKVKINDRTLEKQEIYLKAKR